jgi:hypothetical protein
MSQAWVENVSRVAMLCLGFCFSLGLRCDFEICEEGIYDGGYTVRWFVREVGLCVEI